MELRKVNVDEVFRLLKEDIEKNNKGIIEFTLAEVAIVVKQPNVVGNIIEEWLHSWLYEHGIQHEYNLGQCSPDFWLDLDDRNRGWLEIKSFTGGANFDIANFMSYINDIIDKPWKLDAKYLCIKYSMDDNGVVTIDDIWLKSVWEISSPSSSWAVKVQDKKHVIYNLRPSSWYSQRAGYQTFKCMEHFLSALDFVIKTYPPTSSIGLNWKQRVEKAYSEYHNMHLHIPLWQDIAQEYHWEG